MTNKIIRLWTFLPYRLTYSCGASWDSSLGRSCGHIFVVRSSPRIVDYLHPNTGGAVFSTASSKAEVLVNWCFRFLPLNKWQQWQQQHKDILLAVCQIPGLGEKKLRQLLNKMDTIRKISRLCNYCGSWNHDLWSTFHLPAAKPKRSCRPLDRMNNIPPSHWNS